MKILEIITAVVLLTGVDANQSCPGHAFSRLDEGWAVAGNQYRYLVSRKGMTWSDADELCKSMGASLATVGIRDEVIFEYLHKNFLPQGESMWVGLTDIENEGSWKWTDGVTAISSNTPWGDGQPDDYKPGQDCACMRKTVSSTNYRLQRLDDCVCWSTYRALCELPPNRFV
ncbi:C-type lectin domain family 4 member E-like [Styela clava]